jgi:hypothetical protein
VREPITTTADRVKQGGYWCEDATAITQAALDRHGLNWTDEIPVTWGFENLGLANTILALGSVRPKFQPRADSIVVNLMRKLYSMAVELGIQVGFTITNSGHWLGNPDRATSCKAQHSMWSQLGRDFADPTLKAIADSLAILFGTGPNHISCVHASKLILFAIMNHSGEAAGKQARHDLIEFLQRELET